eukprot:2107094-Pleurochrysis_carterae.AAC.3
MMRCGDESGDEGVPNLEEIIGRSGDWFRPQKINNRAPAEAMRQVLKRVLIGVPGRSTDFMGAGQLSNTCSLHSVDGDDNKSDGGAGTAHAVDSEKGADARQAELFQVFISANPV